MPNDEVLVRERNYSAASASTQGNIVTFMFYSTLKKQIHMPWPSVAVLTVSAENWSCCCQTSIVFFFLPLDFFKTYKTTLAFLGSRISSPCQQAPGRRSRQDNHLFRSEHTVSAISLYLVLLAVWLFFCGGPSNSYNLFQLLTDHQMFLTSHNSLFTMKHCLGSHS